MAKKCDCPPAGAPEWVMTYGDMMSLLLCFFIMLVALSEIKKEEFKVKAEAIKSAFASSTMGGGAIPSPDNPDFSIIAMLEARQLRNDTQVNQSKNDVQGIDGSTNTVRQVREGMLEPVGGRIFFEPGSATLTAGARRQIMQIVPLIRGETNKIELRGHASSIELARGGEYDDLMALSYARARAVMEFLTSDEAGIEPQRIRLSANADHEQLRHRMYDRDVQEPNRRVEIIVMQAIVEDLARPEVSGSR